nr:PfkB family carbohydrate kinase [Metabacillus flavus]
MNEDSYLEASERAAEKGARVIFDTGGKALEKALQAKPFLIKPNLQELTGLFGRNYDLNDVNEIAKDLKKAADAGAHAIALTLGSRGSIFYSGGLTLFAAAPKVHAVNPTGCGDAFLAGFTAALFKGLGWKEAMISGTAAGAANAMEWTAGTIRIENYEHIKHTVQVFCV